ncbi:MAG TPA: amino acid permease, partial [Burkholderiales bacterium]
QGPAPFQTPLYPVVPFAFSVMCLYMLYSSIDYVRNPEYGPKFGAAVVAGIVVMIAGIPIYLFIRKK